MLALLKEVLGEPLPIGGALAKAFPDAFGQGFFFVHKLALAFDLNGLSRYSGGGVAGGVGLGLCKSVSLLALPSSS